MFQYKITLLLIFSIFSTLTFSETIHTQLGTPKAKKFLEKIIEQNNSYIKNQGPGFFAKKSKGQKPIVTMIGCSDSRVHLGIIDENPEGDIFVIRNIGNQLLTAKGSVEYGINYLHSDILLIVGHSECGAVQAASGDFSDLNPEVIKELADMNLKKGQSNIDGVKANVHYQVLRSLQKFSKLVAENKLLIVGAVYDFSDDMHLGAGKLNIINIQGRNLEQKSDDVVD
ncbi:MAG: carbonic anhydrase [Legionellaceae bacterium]|nr:carbonic anhydrase [Legionellaceae bacterium]